jgi:hypothetical protein
MRVRAINGGRLGFKGTGVGTCSSGLHRARIAVIVVVIRVRSVGREVLLDLLDLLALAVRVRLVQRALSTRPHNVKKGKLHHRRLTSGSTTGAGWATETPIDSSIMDPIAALLATLRRAWCR